MKQFLYLDTDIVDSIIAQKEKGLIKESSREQQQSGSSADGTSSTSSVIGGIDASLISLFHSQVQGSKDDTSKSENSSHWAYRNIITKTLHDAAFDMALDYIRPNDSLESVHLGSYIKLNREFAFADFDYLESFCTKGGLYEQMLRFQMANTDNNNSSPNIQQPKKEQKRQQQQRRQQINITAKTARDTVYLAKGIVPYDRVLISDDGFIIPLENEYFRVNPKRMAFKYSGITTCVGMITNIIDKGQKTSSSNLFSTLQSSVNDAIFSILQVEQSKIFVVHPIAVYYGG